MTLYDKYKKLDIDFSAVGLEKRNEKSEYFCTPKDATVIGWAGVDGIHYCFTENNGDTVFAVDPMSGRGDHVHPVAKNFEDFLRLILACGDAAAIQQAYAWSKDRFYAFLNENPITENQSAVIDVIAKSFGLSPMEHPYEYIRKLQNDFDYGNIIYGPDYEEWEPKTPESVIEGKVYFDGGFGNGKGRAGKKIPVNERFVWGEEEWYVPAVYSCAKGLVVDCLAKVDREKVRSYIDLALYLESGNAPISKEAEEELRTSNPMNADFKLTLEVNGKRLLAAHSYGDQWIPRDMIPEDIPYDVSAEYTLKTYGLDPEQPWMLRRISFPWATAKKPDIKSVIFHFEQRPVSLPGIKFTAPEAGKSIIFKNPATGVKHTLAVYEYEKTEISSPNVRNVYTIPTHCHVMRYTLTPRLERSEFVIRDTEESDAPIIKTAQPQDSAEAASIGIIGGADGPVAVFGAVREKTGTPNALMLSATSSLHFEERDVVTWEMVFKTKTREDVRIEHKI